MDIEDYAEGLEHGREMAFEDFDGALDEAIGEDGLDEEGWEETLREALEKGFKEVKHHHAEEDTSHSEGMLQGYSFAKDRITEILNSTRTAEEKRTAILEGF